MYLSDGDTTTILNMFMYFPNNKWLVFPSSIINQCVFFTLLCFKPKWFIHTFEKPEEKRQRKKGKLEYNFEPERLALAKNRYLILSATSVLIIVIFAFLLSRFDLYLSEDSIAWFAIIHTVVFVAIGRYVRQTIL